MINLYGDDVKTSNDVLIYIGKLNNYTLNDNDVIKFYLNSKNYFFKGINNDDFKLSLSKNIKSHKRCLKLTLN